MDMNNFRVMRDFDWLSFVFRIRKGSCPILILTVIFSELVFGLLKYLNTRKRHGEAPDVYVFFSAKSGKWF